MNYNIMGTSLTYWEWWLKMTDVYNKLGTSSPRLIPCMIAFSWHNLNYDINKWIKQQYKLTNYMKQTMNNVCRYTHRHCHLLNLQEDFCHRPNLHHLPPRYAMTEILFQLPARHAKKLSSSQQHTIVVVAVVITVVAATAAMVLILTITSDRAEFYIVWHCNTAGCSFSMYLSVTF